MSFSTTARPIPCAPPVTTAARPTKLNVMDMHLSSPGTATFVLSDGQSLIGGRPRRRDGTSASGSFGELLGGLAGFLVDGELVVVAVLAGAEVALDLAEKLAEPLP